MILLQGKLCQETVGLRFMTGKLEAGSDVRSVPLGEKRKRGRPKKLPADCLQRSPVHSSVSELVVEVDQVAEEDVAVEDCNDLRPTTVPIEKNVNEVVKTTRKRKHREEVQGEDLEAQHSSIDAILEQANSIGPGLGNSKPPKRGKKTARNQPEPEPIGNPKPPLKRARIQSKPATSEADKPSAVICKKKIGTCKHEVVFGVHYDKNAWLKYAGEIRAKKSLIEIDPSYVP